MTYAQDPSNFVIGLKFKKNSASSQFHISIYAGSFESSLSSVISAAFSRSSSAGPEVSSSPFFDLFELIQDLSLHPFQSVRRQHS